MRWPSASRLPVRRIERHAGPAPVVDHALERDERFGIRFAIDAVFAAVAGVLAAHDVLRIDRHHAAEDLVLFLADRAWLERRRRLHRHEGDDLEQMRHDHVAKRAGLLVERGAVVEPERLRHVDLHVIDEVAVPDRLEQTVGEAEREDVLRRLLAEEVIDPEDLLFVEHLVQLGVQRHRAREIGAERLLHDDARALDETGLAQHAHRRQARRSAARSGSAGAGSRRRTRSPLVRPPPRAPRRRPRAARSPALRRTPPSRLHRSCGSRTRRARRARARESRRRRGRRARRR